MMKYSPELPQNWRFEIPFAARQSSDQDAQNIFKWLEAEDFVMGEGFWCNRGVIFRDHLKGELRVILMDREVVAFLAGIPPYPDIIEVKPKFRGMGLGTFLIESMINEAIDLEMEYIKIISEEHNGTFWDRFGFELCHNEPKPLLGLWYVLDLTKGD